MKLPLTPPTMDTLLDGIPRERLGQILRTVSALGDADYRHYDEIRHRQPPDGLTIDEWWLGLKLLRSAPVPVPLADRLGVGCWFSVPGRVQALLHRMDSDALGHIGADSPVATPEARDRYVLNSLIEEAITSSQLEGASTTRKVAADMLRSGRRPRDRSERMIVNNFRTMQRVRELRETPLSPELVLELHRAIIEQTLDDESGAGRLQRPDEERVAVYDNRDGTLLHQPPDAGSLPERLALMCAWANGELDGDRFVHPVVRAIVLHYWLAYDHPFADGNGRTARTLFYWSMLRSGYWLAEFISISRLLHKAPSAYARAFLHTETDGNDLTYFILHQLEIIARAIDDLDAYLARKGRELDALHKRMREHDTLNHRQRALLAHALRHPDARYTIESHRRSHQTAYATARADLLALAAQGLLREGKEGRRMLFTVPRDFEQRLAGEVR